ncbi:interleukin-5 receptor subunit alpha isoform X2 [Pelodiscus sinensis]|uniref:interleukin-5 receptor subunit alpha isoform X2 n=1 Tax=Pelodiscus sinensis TaxID=13735 RepID=UPI003F6D987E
MVLKHVLITISIDYQEDMAIVLSIFPILLWTAMASQTNLLEAKGIQVLPPVNFTLTVSALAEVLLQWKPNPGQEQKNCHVSYDVEILTPESEKYTTNSTHSTRTVVLHNGFSARLQTQLLCNNSKIESNWVTAELQPPSGAVETSVANLSCMIYTSINNSASLHCTWLAGQAAPKDTKYFLFYRYNGYTEECQEYNKDKWGRNIGCQISHTYIKTSGFDQVIIHINGSSKYTAIKPYEQLFDQKAIEKVNPPRNVTVVLKQNNCLVKWKNPASSLFEQCFEYELNIYNCKRDDQQILKTKLNSFSLTIDDTCRNSIQIRANLQSWCGKGFWSDWTEPLYIGKDQLRTSVDSKVYRVLTALLVFICSMALLIAIICRKCHLWRRLFPPIPTPKNSLKNLFLNNNYQRARICTSETETETGSCPEDFGSYSEDLYFDVLEDSVI